MKNYIKILILIAGICFFTGCCLQKTHFTAEEMQWLNPYEEGDTLIFQSAKGEVDTSWIVQKTIYHSRAGCNPINAHGTHQYHTGRIYYQNSTDLYSKDGKTIVSMQKYRDRTGLSLFFKGTRFYFFDIPELDEFKHENGHVFRDDHPRSRPDEPKYIYWHKDHGIIKYITHEGVKWKRINLDFEVE